MNPAPRQRDHEPAHDEALLNRNTILALSIVAVIAVAVVVVVIVVSSGAGSRPKDDTTSAARPPSVAGLLFDQAIAV
ncbi:hypothetical protein CHO01_40410 [Cellulomonas hominis]|uniref:Uncharacterized protein n=1 Tax=Cellulomonas hominis TaxID=156981 RepID=A0A511FI49_9CELL|nr:hypothetical protein [Cellulomonas hominis]MBB5472862.1 hypothetical protein [Cellulomonas hominis]NKY07553.1 hypothetical protein [Cellulomonas hominis]GEL48925.1 hypothetical protein CHO01_40410 [Cellulomonas hominis]